MLGSGRDTSAKDIRSRYLALARRYHPDVNGGDGTAEWIFKRIQQAYQAVREQAGEDATAPARAARNGGGPPRSNRRTDAGESRSDPRNDWWYEWREERRRERQAQYAREQARREHEERVRKARRKTFSWPAAAAIATMAGAGGSGADAGVIWGWGLAAVYLTSVWLWIIGK